MQIITDINKAIRIINKLHNNLLDVTLIYENDYIIEFDTSNTPHLWKKNHHIGTHTNTFMELYSKNGIYINGTIHKFKQLEQI